MTALRSPAAPPPPTARPGEAGRTKRIAVLLDDAVLTAVVVRRLDLLGYDAAVVPGPAELTTAAANADALLIDLSLPDRAALKAVERLAAAEITQGVPVLGLAEDCPLAFVEEAFGFGVTDFLVVPFDPLVLERKVAALLADRGAADGGEAPTLQKAA